MRGEGWGEGNDLDLVAKKRRLRETSWPKKKAVIPIDPKKGNNMTFAPLIGRTNETVFIKLTLWPVSCSYSSLVAVLVKEHKLKG